MTTPEPRDIALQTLYQLDRTGDTGSLESLSPKARRLVQGVIAHTPDLDTSIESASEHWSVDRMPVVDRAILRLGLYELRHEQETPAAVVVNEAVRLAKTYSTQRSGSFVNGVLAALAAAERPAHEVPED
ncbi:MAG TPA: transcription antitermination factor NusB [Acidimicrobiia bacterium]|nr:transcription antitermination factor NusB [Acidimicrobiia bacterium]